MKFMENISVRLLSLLYSFTDNTVNLLFSSQSTHVTGHSTQNPNYQSSYSNLFILCVLVIVLS